ncbi:MAG: HD domain-containing protein [Acidobacteriota bacterium]
MAIVRINEPIDQWADGDFAQGYALVVRKDVRQDRKGRDYTDLELADATGSLSAKIWPDSPAQKSRFSEKQFIAFKGTVRQYRDQLQLNVDHCRTVDDADREKGFDEALLIPTAPQGLEELGRRFEAIFPAQIERLELKLLTEKILERHGESLRQHPAAKSIHHAYRGGLLEHVVYMSELALDVCRLYPELDRDLLLLGVLLHDLGKLVELGAMPANDYTVEGQLLGHIVIGQTMLREACTALDGAVPRDLERHLDHLVLSHHGKREYGSPVEPATAEALTLHSLDSLDSRLNQLRSLRRGGAQGMHYHRPMGRNIFFDPSLEKTGPGSE